jgi:hypothetical protein
MMIEDGKGTGLKAEVNDENQLETSSVCVDMVEHKNKDHHVLWYLPLDAVAPSGATKFFYIGNNAGQLNVVVSKIRLSSTVAGIFRFLKVTGTPAGGTTIAPTSLFLSSMQTPADGVFQSGASITGLTDAALLIPYYVPANSVVTLELQAKWYIAPGTALAIQAPAAAVVSGQVTIYTEDGGAG